MLDKESSNVTINLYHAIVYMQPIYELNSILIKAYKALSSTHQWLHSINLCLQAIDQQKTSNLLSENVYKKGNFTLFKKKRNLSRSFSISIWKWNSVIFVAIICIYVRQRKAIRRKEIKILLSSNLLLRNNSNHWLCMNLKKFYECTIDIWQVT